MAQYELQEVLQIDIDKKQYILRDMKNHSIKTVEYRELIKLKQDCGVKGLHYDSTTGYTPSEDVWEYTAKTKTLLDKAEVLGLDMETTSQVLKIEGETYVTFIINNNNRNRIALPLIKLIKNPKKFRKVKIIGGRYIKVDYRILDGIKAEELDVSELINGLDSYNIEFIKVDKITY